jgi:hypothetical protein
MKAADLSETLVSTYQIAWRHNKLNVIFIFTAIRSTNLTTFRLVVLNFLERDIKKLLLLYTYSIKIGDDFIQKS